MANYEVAANKKQRIADFNNRAYRQTGFVGGTYSGQCVTYVRGRGLEKLGVDLGANGLNYAYQYFDFFKNKGRTISYPRMNTACVFNKGRYNGDIAGHIIFIEYVIGNDVWYSEANDNNDNRVSADDGIIKHTTISALINRSGYLGCIRYKSEYYKKVTIKKKHLGLRKRKKLNAKYITKTMKKGDTLYIVKNSEVSYFGRRFAKVKYGNRYHWIITKMINGGKTIK